MFTLTRNTQYYKALSVNINFLLLGMWQSPVPIGIVNLHQFAEQNI